MERFFIVSFTLVKLLYVHWRKRAPVLFVFFLWAMTGYAQSTESVNAFLAKSLQAVLEDEFESQVSTGFTAAVFMPDNTLWTGTAGMSNPVLGDSFRTDQRIAFASITKTFVAALMLQLVEEEVLTLEDTIGDWLPMMHFVNPAVTISQLLNHQSGLYNFTNHPDLVPAAFRDLERHWTPEELIASFLSQPLYLPGRSSGYSNTNFILSGMIAEAATGEKLSVLLRERFLDPYRLTATYLGSDEAATGELVTTWFDLDGNGSLDDYSEFQDASSFLSLRWAAGGMLSTPEDIAQWAKILFTEDMLQKETRERMLTFLPINGTATTWTGYGLGVQEYEIAETTFWGHSGSTRGATSLMVYAPEHNISIALAANDNRANHVSLAGRLFEAAIAATVNTAVDSYNSPKRHELHVSAYPNPFQHTMSFEYIVEYATSVTFRIYDILGRAVFNRSYIWQEAGSHRIEWSGTDSKGNTVASGLYVYTLEVGKRQITGRVIRY